MSTTRRLISMARFRGRREVMQKSRGTAPAKAPTLAIDPAKKAKAPPTYPGRGSYVRVQRPGLHEQPALARLLGVGRHGITVADDQGRPVKVRHEHVLERHAAPSGKERASFAQAMAAQGVPVSMAERFLRLNGNGSAVRRPTRSQIGLLQELVDGHGVPIDMAAVQEGGSYEEIEQLLGMFVSDPEGRIGIASE